jgi:DNA segregation ATPase FtsK/SpoIIIE, S-DNA-T family
MRCHEKRGGFIVLELSLRVELVSGDAVDVTVTCSASHRLGDLADAVAGHLGVRMDPGAGGAGLHCDRLSGSLHDGVRVVDSGLVSGDRVRIGGPPDDPTTRVDPSAPTGASAREGWCCEVVSGPSNGVPVPLGPGRTSIGRDPTCGLVVADPTVSRRHVELVVDVEGAVQVTPVAAVTNPVRLDGVVVTEPVTVPDGGVLQLGACAVTVRWRGPRAGPARDRLGQIPFTRTPSKHPDLRPVEVRGPGRAPGPYEPRPLMLAATLTPAIGAVAFAVLLGNPRFLLLGALSPVAMLASWWSERRRSGTSHRQQVATFDRRFAGWLERYDEALADERRRRSTAAPDLADLARRAHERSYDLWPRASTRDGFLHLRVGLGDAEAATTTARPGGVEDDPDARVEDAIEARRILPSVPIVLDLLAQGVVALHGPPGEVDAAAASLLCQLAVLHSPDEVVLCAALGTDRSLTDWVAWLPHTRTVASPLVGEHVVVGREAADDLVRRVLAVTPRRPVTPGGEVVGHGPAVVVVLDGAVGIDPALVAALCERAPATPIAVLWLDESRASLPRHATAVVASPPVGSAARASLWFTDPSTPTRELDLDRVGADAATVIARSLSPVRDASSRSATASVPRTAPLLEVLGAGAADPRELAATWQDDAGGLPARLGTGATGPLTVDLVEHGPHALIAGTSGSGKSELLRAAIASLLVSCPPDRLNLLFIDYKGGASCDVFRAAPHTVGTVTNLRADLAARALTSLRAELDRRMRVLEGRATDLAEMLERFPDDAPARLVIVIDEFATLVAEVPDFLAGVVDIAQRGRSLGIHLILATQRPGGAVSDDLLANVNLRIALRVLDAADSTAILGSGEAASIPAPLRGRAFAALGSGRLTEFQSAYPGTAWRPGADVEPIVVTDLRPGGSRETVHPTPVPRPEGERTHLDAVVAAVAGAADALGDRCGRAPWLEELPEHIDLADVRAGRFGATPRCRAGRDVVLGVLDEPTHQRQRPYVVDLAASGGLLIHGTAGSGRSTLLRTVLGSLVAEASPREVEVYVLDFGGRALTAAGDLPHVAAVAPGDDLEQATRILTHLRSEVRRRQQLLAAHRAEDLTALAQELPVPLPRLALLLDGYDAFTRTFERGTFHRWSELLVETVLAGRGIGLHLVASASRRADVPPALMTAISARVVCRTADRDGLVDLGIPHAIAREAHLGDGRALLPDGTTVQLAVVGRDAAAAAQVAALGEVAATTALGHGPNTLPELPGHIELEAVVDRSTAAVGAPRSVVLGPADLTGAPVVCDLAAHHLAVVGPPESGRSTALRTVVRQLRERDADVWILSEPSSPLAGVVADQRSLRRDGDAALLEELAEVVADDDGGPPPIVVIDRGERVTATAGRMLDALLQRDAVRVLAGVDGSTLSGYVAGWLAHLKDTRRLLLLQPDELGELRTLTPVAVPLRPGQTFPPGRGVLVSGRDVTLLQVAC